MDEMTDEQWELLNTPIACPTCENGITDAWTKQCFACGCRERGCTIVQKNPDHNRHYHCGLCGSPDATSYQGHYGRSADGRWGYSCQDYAS